jgi:hypothetical protein
LDVVVKPTGVGRQIFFIFPNRLLATVLFVGKSLVESVPKATNQR